MPDGHAGVPLARQVQAQLVAGIDVRQAGRTGPQLQSGVPDPGGRPEAVLVADLDGIRAGQLGGLQAGGADQSVPAEAAGRAGDGLAYPVRLLRQAEPAAGQRGSP